VACSSCLRWGIVGNSNRLGCRKWDVTPPEETQLKGCDDWAYDSIPF
jgi:hypothetical protein